MKNKADIMKFIEDKVNEKIKELENKIETNSTELELLRGQKVEALLYNYTKYKKKIQNLELEINNLENENVEILNKKGNNDVKVQTTRHYTERLEFIQNSIDVLNNKVNRLLYITNKIENALDCIDDGINVKIIKLKFFEKREISDICESLNMSKATYNRIKNMTLQEIKSILFI